MIGVSRTFHGLPARRAPAPSQRAGVRLAAPPCMRLTSLSVAVLCACSSNPSEPDVLAARELPAAVKDDAAAIALANNQFAFDLYALLAPDHDNLFMSPFSISTALAMVDAGAAGTTDQELRRTLRFTVPGDRMHSAYGALLDSLDVGRGFGTYTLATANRLFGQTGLPFVPDFLTITRRDYGAELQQVDFERDPEAARATVNAWVADNTDGKIEELFASGAFDMTTRLVLANAIVFKGAWANHFDTSLTTDGAFQLSDGRTIRTPMMHKRDVIATTSIPGGRLGVLPFRGKDLSMLVLLPDRPDGLPTLEAQFTGDAIAPLIARVRGLQVPSNAEEVDVALPRFSITSGFELPDLLAKLGMVSAFDPDAADFSGIDGKRDLYIQRVVHKATITVDENGAEAAAATGVGVGTTSTPQPFVADRPFLFAIYDHVSESILFLGRVVNPSA